MYRETKCPFFLVKNEGRPSDEIDLHGLYVQEASEKVEEAIKRCKRENADHLVIIVGKGLHSPDKIAKLKPAIIELVNKYDINCQPNTPNPGCLYVRFDGKGDMSWLNHIQEKLAGKECLIM